MFTFTLFLSVALIEVSWGQGMVTRVEIWYGMILELGTRYGILE